MNNTSLSSIEKIRSRYEERPKDPLTEIKALDKKVSRTVKIISYVIGSVGAVIMGTGMSLVMTDLGKTLGLENSLISGIVIGCIGMAVALINYPIYKRVIANRRKKYAPMILELSDKIKDEI